MSASEYDLVVIGSGPAGQKGAIAAAKARKRIAIIDQTDMIGGVTVHTGTIPSKTLREAIFQLGKDATFRYPEPLRIFGAEYSEGSARSDFFD